MQKLLINLCLVSSLIISCKKEEFVAPDFKLEIVNDSLDVNNDGINDFFLQEWELETDDAPSSGGTLCKSMSYIGNNNKSIVINPEKENIHASDFNTLNVSWTSIIIYKNRVYEEYDDYWSPGFSNSYLPNSEINEQVIGFKIIDQSNKNLLGWIKFEFDKASGEINVNDFNYTYQNTIQIRK